MLFNSPNNYSAMDREYSANSGLEPASAYFSGPGFSDIHGHDHAGGAPAAPMFEVNELGQTVPEGQQFGNFQDTMAGAIRAGAGTVELALEGRQGVKYGAEAYGKEARQALREMAQSNEVKITTVHAPAEVGNLSGFTGPERGFNDEQRKVFVDEVKRAINFLADISPDGGAVVIHTGEFQRPISEQPWASWVDERGERHYKFKGYEEEPYRTIIPVVDDRTGAVFTQVRKNQEVPRAVWNRYEQENASTWSEHGGKAYYDSKGQLVQPGDYINYEGEKVKREDRVARYNPTTGRFDVREQNWNDFVKEAEELNLEKERQVGRPLRSEERVLPEEAFIRATAETQMKISEGWAGIYARDLDGTFESMKRLKQALEYYKKLESNIPEDEKWRIQEYDLPRALQGMQKYIPPDAKNPSEIIQKHLDELQHTLVNYREAVVGQTQAAMEQKLLQNHVVSASRYAKKKSIQSYADAALYAHDQTHEKHLDKPIFLAPENLWPEMGWGTHPTELRELVVSARQEMAQRLMKERGLARDEAERRSKEHIKTTIDFQHLGMWWKHFEPAYAGEPEAERKKRFDAWFLDEFKKLADEGLVGNLHIVDGMGGAHHHLPPGQGVFPIKTALEYLKEKGYTGSYNSEAWGEGPARQLAKTWEYMGAWTRPVGFVGPMAPGTGQRWSDVFQSYFGRTYPPNYIFGTYAPSNDWTLWSQVPME